MGLKIVICVMCDQWTLKSLGMAQQGLALLAPANRITSVQILK